MKALISKKEARMGGYRVAQVVQDWETFEVHGDLQWIDCDDHVRADEYWYDPETNLFTVFEPS